jgi:lysophospholipase L1-like esterase
MGVQVNDLYGFVTDAGTQRIVSDDGVHFTDEGKSLLGEAVAEYINGVLS